MTSSHTALGPAGFPPFSSFHLHLPAPLRSPGITRLHRYYGCSDSCDMPRACRLRTGLSAYCVWPSKHSVSNHLTASHRRFRTQPFSAMGSPALRGSGLRPTLAGSPIGPAESSLSAYGLLLHLPLLPTPPRGDAVTVSYRPEWACLKGTCTLPTRHPHGRTSAPLRGASSSAPREECATEWRAPGGLQLVEALVSC